MFRVHATATILTLQSAPDDTADRLNQLAHAIEHAAHLLPSQGPITVFVHHNTLHAFEDLPFEQAVKQGLSRYGSQPYLPEEDYRAKLARGRIRAEDIAFVLLEDLGDSAEELIGFMGTRYHLRLAMLEHPIHFGTDHEVRWLIAETDALDRFSEQSPERYRLRRKSIDETRRWVMRDLQQSPEEDPVLKELVVGLFHQFGASRVDSWSDATWEAFTLHLIWQLCYRGVHGVARFVEPEPPAVRHRDLLFRETGEDTDQIVNELLVRFCSAFLDQGVANWPLPQRELGFFRCFSELYRTSRPLPRWLRGLPAELQRLNAQGSTPLESILESLQLLGVDAEEQDAYLTQTLLALPGWTGMLWQMETVAKWTVYPAPDGSLVEYLAIRLILERLALAELGRDYVRDRGDLASLRDELRRRVCLAPRASVDQRAYVVFQLAQVRGWSASDLFHLTKLEWSRLVREIETFSSVERRRIYHLAFERRYRIMALDALSVHSARASVRYEGPKTFQIVTCIDDREESFHRHLEEVDPQCQTLSTAGFFAVAMYYRGAADAHFRPLCPVVITPKHYVVEEAAYSLTASSRQRAETRKTLGAASHQWHVQSRTLWGAAFIALLGPLASVPMVMRILFPRLTARMRRVFGSLIQPPPVTELMLVRSANPPGPDAQHLGFTLEEAADCVERVLRDIGLTRDFARIVLFLGHGSGSLNNPHESAYNCGACSGSRGGPNARAYAQMANQPQVRELLYRRGLVIPPTTIFVGGFHNTCDDDVTYFDLDRIPITHREEFEASRDVIDEARARNAHERCRRFELADLTWNAQQALEHAQTRAEDLSQVRPEYNHATNAMCVVSRRDRTRGLFLDRRAFLCDYDPTQDDEQHTILARILGAVVPVCAGISLEYYFSCVDTAGYGCGSKLPHNIVSLLGVMEGASGDLRPGLSQQMVEIHEPLRILFVIETTPAAMLSIMARNETIDRLVRNEWVQLAVVDPQSPQIQVFRDGAFGAYQPETNWLPTVRTSLDWYRGQRDDLGFAEINPQAGTVALERVVS